MTPRSFGEWCGCTAAVVLVLTAVLFASFWVDRFYIRFHARISKTDLEERMKRLEQRIAQVPSAAFDQDTGKIVFWIGAYCKGRNAKTWSLIFAEPYGVEAEALR